MLKKRSLVKFRRKGAVEIMPVDFRIKRGFNYILGTAKYMKVIPKDTQNSSDSSFRSFLPDIISH